MLVFTSIFIRQAKVTFISKNYTLLYLNILRKQFDMKEVKIQLTFTMEATSTCCFLHLVSLSEKRTGSILPRLRSYTFVAKVIVLSIWIYHKMYGQAVRHISCISSFVVVVVVVMIWHSRKLRHLFKSSFAYPILKTVKAFVYTNHPAKPEQVVFVFSIQIEKYQKYFSICMLNNSLGD